MSLQGHYSLYTYVNGVEETRGRYPGSERGKRNIARDGVGSRIPCEK